MTDRNRLVAAIAVVVLLVVAALVTDSTPEAPAASASGARLADAGANTTWYCAEGTANPGGRADEELAIGNVDHRPMRAVVTVDGGSDVAPVVHTYAVAPGRVARVRVAEIAPIAEPGVVVETTRWSGSGRAHAGP